MFKKLKYLLVIFFLGFPLQVYGVTQGSDEVSLLEPTEAETISGTYNVQWRIVDAEINEPAYFVDVFNLKCDQSGGNIGRLTNFGATKNGNLYTYSWNSEEGNISGSLQDQGNYCMRVCGILADGGTVYSLCDKKSFVYSSNQQTNNQPPSIEAEDDGFSISLNQVFNYKVVANDADDDTLNYTFVNAPEFLTINQTTGEVSGKPTEVGDIKFIVKADDGKGGVATQEFVMNVKLQSESDEVEFVFPKTGYTY